MFNFEKKIPLGTKTLFCAQPSGKVDLMYLFNRTSTLCDV